MDFPPPKRQTCRKAGTQSRQVSRQGRRLGRRTGDCVLFVRARRSFTPAWTPEGVYGGFSNLNPYRPILRRRKAAREKASRHDCGGSASEMANRPVKRRYAERAGRKAIGPSSWTGDGSLATEELPSIDSRSSNHAKITDESHTHNLVSPRGHGHPGLATLGFAGLLLGSAAAGHADPFAEKSDLFLQQQMAAQAYPSQRPFWHGPAPPASGRVGQQSSPIRTRRDGATDPR